MWKFCGKSQFPHSFERIVRNYAKTMPFRKIPTPEDWIKLRYFTQCKRSTRRRQYWCLIPLILFVSGKINVAEVNENPTSLSFLLKKKKKHYVKIVQIQSFFGPHFPAFGLKTVICGVNLRIQSKMGKYGPEKLRIWTIFTQ